MFSKHSRHYINNVFFQTQTSTLINQTIVFSIFMIKRMTKLISLFSIFIVVFLNQSHPTYSFICKQITGLTNFDLFFDEIIASFVNDVQFYLYTNGMRKAEIDPHGFHMKSLTFNPSRRTTVIIHGYLANHESEWVQKLITKLLKWVRFL